MFVAVSTRRLLSLTAGNAKASQNVVKNLSMVSTNANVSVVLVFMVNKITQSLLQCKQNKSNQLLSSPSHQVPKTGARRSISEKISVMGHTSAKYGGRYMVTALPGDGIGPEMIDHVRNLFK